MSRGQTFIKDSRDEEKKEENIFSVFFVWLTLGDEIEKNYFFFPILKIWHYDQLAIKQGEMFAMDQDQVF